MRTGNSERKNSNGRPFGTIVATTKGEAEGGLFQKLKQFPGIKYFGGGEMEFLPFHW